MSASINDKNRAETLLQRFFDRQLSVEEGEELLTIWDAHPDWEREARMNYQVEYPLTFFAAVEKKPLSIHPAIHSVTPFTIDFDNLRSLGEPSPTVADEAGKVTKKELVTPGSGKGRNITPRREERHRSFASLKYIIPLTLLLLITAVYFEFRPMSSSSQSAQEPPFNSFGRIESTADAVSGVPASPLRSNRRIAREPIALTEGTIEILLNNNTRMVLEGPAELQLISDMNAFCSRGRLSVFVPPEAVGFEVTTPTVSIRDLGTEFVVDVSEERSELHVIQGRVEANAQSMEPLIFTTGLGARINESGKFVRRSADLALFVTPEEMRRRAAASRKRENERARIVDERLAEDPSVVFHLDFEDRRGGEKIVGCRRVSGHAPEHRALLFEKHRDVVSCPGSVETDSLTLLATVRVDGLPRTSQTLFTCRDFGRGAVQWQLARGGNIQILIGRGEKASALNFRTGKVLPPELYGTWIQLAVVLDGKGRTITHYLDGEPVARDTMDEPCRFHLSDMEIGNWTQKERTPTHRFFHGAIDGIVLFNRGLSPEEIKNLRPFY